MNIIDAIKSGKKFRRKNWPEGEWLTTDLILQLDGTEIIASDWEIEEKAVWVTRSQLMRALENAAGKFGGSAGTLAQGVLMRGSREICEEVGLGE